MKQTLFLALFSLATMTTVSFGQMGIVDYLSSSSYPCDTIDKKIIELDQFTEVVKNTSAFHLEEKINALPSPGFTVSNNRKQMLRDAKKKRAEYVAERQKEGCKTPMPAVQVADKVVMTDSCAAIDQKIVRLDRFTEVVKNTSAFHLEEKAGALPSPGLTVSNNRKQMLRDAKKKRAEYVAERQKEGCKTPMPAVQVADKVVVAANISSPSISDTAIDKEPKKAEDKTTVNNTTTLGVEKKVAVLPVPKTTVTVSNEKEQMPKNEVVKKTTAPTSEPQKYEAKAPMNAVTPKVADKTAVAQKSSISPEVCNSIDKEFIKLNEFTTMVKNTSAFHLEEKISALPSPGFSVSSNKKKMLRDAKKKRTELLEEYKKAGCEAISAK